MEKTAKYFYGNLISDYGIENGYVDYRTLAKSFDAVLNNGIMKNTCNIGCWEQVSGMVDNSEEIEKLQEQIDNIMYDINEIMESDESFEDSEKHLAMMEKIDGLQGEIDELEYQQNYSTEIFQYYIVSDNAVNLLEEAEEIVFYNEELDMYVWGVTHYGTGWDYVLTSIKIDW